MHAPSFRIVLTLVFTGLMATAVLGAAVAVQANARDRLRDAAEDLLLALAHEQGSRVADFVDLQKERATLVAAPLRPMVAAWVDGDQSQRDAIHAHLEAARESLEGILELHAFGPGAAIASTAKAPPLPAPGLAWDGALRYTHALESEGRLLGWLVLDVDSAPLVAITAGAPQGGATGETLVLQPSSEGPLLLTPLRFSPSPVPRVLQDDAVRRALLVEGAVAQETDYRGEPVLLVGVQAANWVVLLKQDQREVLAPLVDLRLGVLASGIVLVAVAAAVAEFAATWVASPLERLARAAREGRPMSPQRGAREVRQLAHTLDERLAEVTRLAAMVTSSQDAMVRVDGDGRVTAWNPAAQAILAPSLAARPATELVVPAQKETLGDALLAAKQGKPTLLHKMECQGPRGAFPCSIAISPLAGPEGVQGTTLVVRDLTETRRAEEAERHALSRQLELQAVRETNRFKTEFLNAAAHELSNVLSPLRIRVRALQARDRTQADTVKALERNIDRLGLLVQDMLDAVRLQGGKLSIRPGPVDLAALAAEAVETFTEPAKQRGIDLRVEAEPVHLAADEARLTQVLLNLLGNAVKFTSQGGTITVRTRRVGDQARLEVHDGCAGLTPDQIRRLFQPFSRVHDPASSIPGTGLGLYICRGIAEGHGGRIWCESDGKGCTFLLTLPVVPPGGGP
jgi:PAS domain S-box-containing protein